jgi:hypothetical protein
MPIVKWASAFDSFVDCLALLCGPRPVAGSVAADAQYVNVTIDNSAIQNGSGLFLGGNCFNSCLIAML